MALNHKFAKTQKLEIQIIVVVCLILITSIFTNLFYLQKNLSYAQQQYQQNIVENDKKPENKVAEGFNPTKKFTMILENTEIEIAPGEKVKAWAFNGTVPGPTVRLTQGENASILFVNNGTFPHTIHFHALASL